MDTEPLQHLTEQSAGICKWMLQVVGEPRDTEYTWNKAGASGKGRKLECVLVSEDETQYCEGVIRKFGKEPQATEKFEDAEKKYPRFPW